MWPLLFERIMRNIFGGMSMSKLVQELNARGQIIQGLWLKVTKPKGEQAEHESDHRPFRNNDASVWVALMNAE